MNRMSNLREHIEERVLSRHPHLYGSSFDWFTDSDRAMQRYALAAIARMFSNDVSPLVEALALAQNPNSVKVHSDKGVESMNLPTFMDGSVDITDTVRGIALVHSADSVMGFYRVLGDYDSFEFLLVFDPERGVFRVKIANTVAYLSITSLILLVNCITRDFLEGRKCTREEGPGLDPTLLSIFPFSVEAKHSKLNSFSYGPKVVCQSGNVALYGDVPAYGAFLPLPYQYAVNEYARALSDDRRVSLLEVKLDSLSSPRTCMTEFKISNSAVAAESTNWLVNVLSSIKDKLTTGECGFITSGQADKLALCCNDFVYEVSL